MLGCAIWPMCIGLALGHGFSVSPLTVSFRVCHTEKARLGVVFPCLVAGEGVRGPHVAFSCSPYVHLVPPNRGTSYASFGVGNREVGQATTLGLLTHVYDFRPTVYRSMHKVPR